MGSAALGFSAEVRFVNGGFDFGATGWTLVGGAEVVATGEPNDNPFGRVPDGALTMLYQKQSSAAPQFTLSFDFFGGLMSPLFPSPGGFPDTAFASVLFGATELALVPEQFLSGAELSLFDLDAVNGWSGLLSGASLTASPARPGWTCFHGVFDAVPGQPWFAVTFQVLNANGVPGDSAFLVDNFDLVAVPEPAAGVLVVWGFWLVARSRRR